jgi:hypothetical protein
MKKSLLIACTLLTLPLISDEDNWCLNDGFTIWGDVVFYRRGEGNNHRLIIDESGGDCVSRRLVSNFGYLPGFQVGMAYMTLHSLLEAKYLYVEKWESSCHRHDPILLYFSESNPDYTTDFSGADTASAKYASQFQNGEVNYFRYITPRRGDYFSAGWLFGVRYMVLDEDLEVKFHNGSDVSSYVIHTWNHIPAIQAGGTVGWNPMRTLSWDLTAKLGMGFDCSRQKTFWGDLNDTVAIRNYQASTFSVPLVVGAALSLTYQPWRFINLHADYELTYLNGVVLAPDQLDKTSKSRHRIRTIGQAMLYGWTAGIAFTF